jgi:hypothetical protein
MIAQELQRFQAASRAFLRRKGRCDEDVLSEMTVYALEQKEQHPERFVSVEIAYLRATDKLDPRAVMTAKGKKERRSWRTRQFKLNDDSLACGSTRESLPDMKIKGPLRAMVLLIEAYGYSMEEVAWLWGVSPSRITQLLGKGKAEVLAGCLPDRDFKFDTLAFDVPCITL